MDQNTLLGTVLALVGLVDIVMGQAMAARIPAAARSAFLGGGLVMLIGGVVLGLGVFRVL